MKSSMNIAFIASIGAVYKKSSWSITYQYMKESLSKNCGNVIYIEPAFTFLMFLGKVFNKILTIILRKKFDVLHSVIISKYYGRLYTKKLNKAQYDIIFAPAASTEIAYLKCNIPIVYWCDSTFHVVKNYYPEFSNLLKNSLKSSEIVEGYAIKNSDILTYSSQWAANSAVEDYGADPSKVYVISHGANFSDVPPEDNLVIRKLNDKCKLLFLGVNWKRKGGYIAFEAFKKLKEMGLKTELIVCGCEPPSDISDDDITVYPFLDKGIKEDRDKLYNIIMTSNFLFVPTRADCSPIIFSESSAFGLPIISTDTGGVSGMVFNNKNGFLLSYEAKGEEYANVIYNIFSNEEKYKELIQCTRKTYNEVLNWDSWGKSMKKIFDKLVSND